MLLQRGESELEIREDDGENHNHCRRHFPLRWESTGDQWWYAAPIDVAASNGYRDVVRELLRLDPNLLIKLTSLRRTRRLESLWDDDDDDDDDDRGGNGPGPANCRASVARDLFLECELKGLTMNALVRAGYGGWLLYAAAAAGDLGFGRHLLDRMPLLVFGEGEYGVTDMLYAAAWSGDSEVFRLLFDSAMSPRCSSSGPGEAAELANRPEEFRREIANRAVHAAARGGSVGILRELLENCEGGGDVLHCRDAQGSTVLHSAAARGRVEVVKYLLASYDIVDTRDNQGNTALHVAAFRGHLPVVEALVSSSASSLLLLTNNAGYTFLHMALEGFRAPGFRRLDRQMELMKELILGKLVEIQSIINIQNNEGQTALHMALIGTVHSDLVELLMAARSINLNIRDIDGMTPLDLLRKNQRLVSSEILIKRLVSFGGISSSKDYIAKSVIASHFKMHGLGNSPGTSFRISDAEIFLYADIEAPEDSGRLSSCSSASQSEISQFSPNGEKYESLKKKKNSFYAVLLRWRRRKGKKLGKLKKLEEDDESLYSFQKCSPCVEIPTPLRQQFCKSTSLLNNKRTYAVNTSMPSPDTMRRFAASLSHGVIQPTPDLARTYHSKSSSFSRSPMSSPHFDKQKGDFFEDEKNATIASCSNSPAKSGKLMNKYFSFGAQGSNRKFEPSVLSAA